MTTEQLTSIAMLKTGSPHSSGVFAVREGLALPNPRGRDILVQVRSVSVNPIDCRIRRGESTGPESGVLGFDAAGVVTAVGATTRLFGVGDHVYYAGQIDRSGANTNLQVVDERIVGHKPKNVSFAEAAALPLTALTAWEGLFDKLRLNSASAGTLLVLGGGGGVGSMVIQLAHALTDVRVIASASRSETRRWVKELGAHTVVNHSSENLEEEIRRAAPAGVDYVFSTHSAGILPLLARVMNPFGQIVAIDSAPEDDFQVLKPKAITWHWENVFARAVHGALDITNQHRVLDAVADLVEARKIRPTMTQVFQGVTVANLREAHRRLELGHTAGKIVLVRDDVPESGLLPRGFKVE